MDFKVAIVVVGIDQMKEKVGAMPTVSMIEARQKRTAAAIMDEYRGYILGASFGLQVGCR